MGLFLASPSSAQKRIYIAPDDHTDYFWSADEDVYRDAFIEMIDYYLDLADTTDGEVPEHQSRWNCDGSFWLWTYEQNKTPAEFDRLIDRIRDGHISAPLTALVSCLGGAPAEAVLRGMYYPGQLERRYNLRFPMAVCMENQVLPYGLGALWSGSGAKYSWKGICLCDTLVDDAWDREHDIYWWAGPDQTRVLMKWNSMLQNNKSMGGYAEAWDPSDIVDYVDADPAFIARYPYDVIGAFGKGWDDLKTLTDEFVTVAKAKTNPSRTVIVSNEQDFFEDFESSHGAAIPTQGCSFGNEWDLYCAAMAEVSAQVKRAVEKLRAAEAMASLVSLQDPTFMTGREAARDLAWMDLGLYWEHNWGMVGPPTGTDGVTKRIAWQRRIAGEIASYVDTLHDDAAAALGAMIQQSGTDTRFYAFNPLSWTRTDAADLPYADTNPVHVVDLATGLETPSQIVTVDGERMLRVLAEDVPPAGYKVFEIRSGSGTVYSDAATVVGSTIENTVYRVTVAANGAIASLIDKTRSNREFVRVISGRAMNDPGPGSGSVSVENAGPVSVTLLATSSGPLNHTSRITLFRDSARIDIVNDITQNFDATQTYAFGFELNSHEVWHEEVGAVIQAKLLADGGHYSPRNARYDWLTLNHFADVHNATVGVTLSNSDCYFMKLGSSTDDALDTATPQIYALAGGKVVRGGNGIDNQAGDSAFRHRFALSTHGGYDAPEAMRFALEHQNPLVTALVSGGAAYPETSYSFITISEPDALLWALKPADDGIDQEVVARIWNLGGADVPMSLTSARGPIESAKRTTHIETTIESATVAGGALTATIPAQGMQTFAFTFEPQGALAVTSPNGGEAWDRGTTQTITWSSSGAVGPSVAIELYSNGTFTRALASATPDDGSYDWNIPLGEPLGSTYRVRIYSVGDPSISDFSDGTFSITGTAVPGTITVTAPNGGETWDRGTTQTITWGSTGDIGLTVEIRLYKGGAFVRTLAASVLNTGSHDWDITPSEPVGTDYTVRVNSVSDPTILDFSDGDFTIVEPPPPGTITVTAPNGGESWVQGSTQDITWSSTGSPGPQVAIDLYDGGVFARTIVNPTSNDGLFAWSIPVDEPVGSYTVRIRSVSVPAVADVSDGDFDITPIDPAITVISPNGGEAWVNGARYNIVWTSVGAVWPDVDIYLLKGGAVVRALATAVPNSGLFQWDIPVSDPADTDYRIRINATSDPSIVDDSDGDFTLLGDIGLPQSSTVGLALLGAALCVAAGLRLRRPARQRE